MGSVTDLALILTAVPQRLGPAMRVSSTRPMVVRNSARDSYASLPLERREARGLVLTVQGIAGAHIFARACHR